jgi:hypothetical protein
MADYSYLVEVVADGENLGKIQFLSFFDTLKEVVDEFIDDRDVKEDINVELMEYTLKRVEKFSSKFKDFVRIRNDSVLADGDVLRAVFRSSDHGNPPSGNPIDSM